MWLHAVAAIFAVTLGVGFRLSVDEWRWIVLAIGWVWMAEAFNTAIERLADAVTLERDPQIGLVKDLAAAGVLLSAIGAAMIGLLVFGPHLLPR
jgi:diacylglycerol kinase